MTSITEFIVRKNNLGETRVAAREAPTLEDGEVLAKIDRFALTANNVTYGVIGERIGYWNFFPVTGDGDGIIPVWGFAEIIESKCDDVPVGERLYGYWPMASHLVIKPANVSERRLFDGAAHRAGLPPIYNAYSRVKAEPGYDKNMDCERMVLVPLFATSFCLYDFFKDNEWFGAEQIIIPSASSKTAIGTAYAMKTDEASPPLIGLTSTNNEKAVRGLGLYDKVRPYDRLDEIDAATPTAIIDMSGNGKILGALHKALGDNMKYTCQVGLTHYADNDQDADFIGERSAIFFAPAQIQKRAEEWGPGVFEQRTFEFWRDAAIKSRDWLIIKERKGAEAVEGTWREVLAGATRPDQAWVVGF